MNPRSFFLFLLLSFINFFTTKYSKKTTAVTYSLVILNILSLILIKYIASPVFFLSTNSFLLPTGISIFIFQQVSFLLDSRHHRQSDLTFSNFLLYSFFLGNITTGPIEKFSHFTKQKKSILVFTKTGLELGVIYICTGLFKKMVVADNLNIFSVFLFKERAVYESNLIIPFLFNKYEIYANFSGFTDIAIGVGAIFGFSLPQNFNRPFAVSSIIEFWKRWHMSLIAWIREYVFYPLTTSRFNIFGPQPIMAITFLIFALWHNFTIPHLLYGIIQVVLVYLSFQFGFLNQTIENTNAIIKIPLKMIKWLWFYIILLSIPGILFRVSTMEQFNLIIKNLVTTPIVSAGYFVQQSTGYITLTLAMVFVMELFEKYVRHEGILRFIQTKGLSTRALFLIIFIFILFLLSHNYSTSNFIYADY